MNAEYCFGPSVGKTSVRYVYNFNVKSDFSSSSPKLFVISIFPLHDALPFSHSFLALRHHTRYLVAFDNPQSR